MRHADGELERIEEDSIHDATGSAPEGYNAPNKKIFSLPHAEPGAILHVRLERVWKRLSEPHVFEAIPLNDPVPIVVQKVEVSCAGEIGVPFSFLPSRRRVIPSSRTRLMARSYSWQFQNIPAAPQEPLSAYDAAPILAISTYPDWAAFAEWYRRLIHESNVITPEIEAQAHDLRRMRRRTAIKSRR